METLSVTAYAVPDSPFCRCATSVPLFVTCGDISPRRGENLSRPGEVFPLRGSFICADRKIQKAPPFGGAGERSEPEGVCSQSSVLALSGANAPALPKGEPLAKPHTLRFSRKLCRHAKASPFGRGGSERSELTERASPLKVFPLSLVFIISLLTTNRTLP